MAPRYDLRNGSRDAPVIAELCVLIEQSSDFANQLHPLVAPQLEHLWQAPERTMIDPHSWHVGASVSATQTWVDSPADLAAAAGRTGTRGRSSWLAVMAATTASFGCRNLRFSHLKM